MVNDGKKQLLSDYRDVVSYLKPHKLPKKTCRKQEVRYCIYYSLRPTRARAPRAPSAPTTTARRLKTTGTSRKTVPKTKPKPVKRLLRTTKPATAQRKRAGTSRSCAARQVAAGSAEEVNQSFLNTVDSLELIRAQFQSRARSSRPSSVADSAGSGSGSGDGDGDGDGDDANPPTSTLTQIFSNYFGGLWP